MSILKQLYRLSDLFKLSDAASVFRCFPPSTLEADDGYSYNSTTLEEVASSNSEKDSVFLEGVASSDLSDCAPQESPVAEAGPGVSYPGYKQYCRCEQRRSHYPSSLFLIVFFCAGPDSSGCHGSADVSEGKSSRSTLSSDQPKFLPINLVFSDQHSFELEIILSQNQKLNSFNKLNRSYCCLLFDLKKF